MLSGIAPDGEQDALALVVARPVRVGLAEVAGDDWAVDRAHDVGQGDLVGRPGEHVASAHPTLRTHQAGTLQGEEDLLEVGLGQAGAFGDVAHRRRALGLGVQGE